MAKLILMYFKDEMAERIASALAEARAKDHTVMNM